MIKSGLGLSTDKFVERQVAEGQVPGAGGWRTEQLLFAGYRVSVPEEKGSVNRWWGWCYNKVKVLHAPTVHLKIVKRVNIM